MDAQHLLWQEGSMTESAQSASAPRSANEALEALIQMAGRRTLPIPAELLARHALDLPGEWDWPVRRAAFEALLRRLALARSQRIAVVRGPRRSPWGRYSLCRAGGQPLPYELDLSSVQPARGACGCPDFLRASLGLCKHLLAVLDHLAKKRAVFARLSAEGAKLQARSTLVWQPAMPAPGLTDPLAALMLNPGHTGRQGRRGSRAVPAGLARMFRVSPDGQQRLSSTFAEDPSARLRLVSKLQAAAGRVPAVADPAARAVLREERARLERVMDLRRAAPRLARALRRGKRPLYEYQQEGVKRFLAGGRLVLADDMGLGKTTQAIAAASALFEAGLARRGLFVVPASLKPQWEREWQAVSDVALRIVEGGADSRRELYTSTRQGLLVTNYEQVVRDLEVIAAWAPDLVVLDEAQRIKNWASKTALTVKHLKPTYRLVLTGTPMENRLDELASIVEWVDDRALEPKWRLAPWHSVYADGAREVVGARNLDTLRERLAPVLLRRIRAEVLAQLPARQDTVIPVDLTEEQRAAHDEFLQPIAKLARVAQRRPLTQPEFLRLMSLLLTQRVISNGMAQLDFQSIWPALRDRTPTVKLIESLATPKLLELRELVSSLVLTQGRKVVVFSQFRRMLDLASWAVSDLLAAEGRRALFFTGQEGSRRRTHNLVDFHDDPRAAILFLTDAGGVGLNLQKAANACINLELPWNPAVLEQRIGRIHRHGQKRPIDVYNLVSRACIEERIAALVADKRALFNGVFDGTSSELKFDRSSTLLQMLERLSPDIVEEATKSGIGAEAVEGGDDQLGPASVAESSAHDLSREAQELVAAATPGGEGDASAVRRPPSAGEISGLFGALRVERAADGAIRIEAPPTAARALTALFEGIARMMDAAAAAPSAPASKDSTSTGASSGASSVE
jgi:superfamily II DNA or RNA helicase